MPDVEREVSSSRRSNLGRGKADTPDDGAAVALRVQTLDIDFWI